MNFTLKNRLRFLPETVIVSIIAVPLILTEKSTHFMYNHTCRMGNGSGSRRRLLNPVQAALKSPFSKSIHTAIPPPAALCNINRLLKAQSRICKFTSCKSQPELLIFIFNGDLIKNCLIKMFVRKRCIITRFVATNFS